MIPNKSPCQKTRNPLRHRTFFVCVRGICIEGESAHGWGGGGERLGPDVPLRRGSYSFFSLPCFSITIPIRILPNENLHPRNAVLRTRHYIFIYERKFTYTRITKLQRRASHLSRVLENSIFSIHSQSHTCDNPFSFPFSIIISLKIYASRVQKMKAEADGFPRGKHFMSYRRPFASPWKIEMFFTRTYWISFSY